MATRGSRYQRYAGGDPLAPPVDLAEALDAIGEDVMAGYSPERAMRELLRRGTRDQQGLDDLMRRVAEKRRELLARHDLDGTLREVTELLERAVLAERGQLARDVTMDDADRTLREMQLENLSPSTAAAVSELASYDWASSEARETYEQIKDLLGRELLDQRFAGMKQALEGASDADRAAIAAMLTDLNALLEKHARGEDTEQDFRDFMAEHGAYFPEDPQSVEELVDAMAQRAAAAQRMLNSMTPEQRAELMELSAQAFGSPALLDELSRLDANLQGLRPGEDWGGSEQFGGSEGLGLGDGTGALQDLAELDALAEQLAQSHPGARLDDVDLDALARQVGDDAAVDARTLAELERALRSSGYLQRGSDGQLRLSPQAMRQLGKALLRDVSQRLSGRQGAREMRSGGGSADATGGTREWAFGDTEPWDLPRTVLNAVRREVAAGGRPAGARGVRLEIGDVEVTESEQRTQAAVALLVDTSFSMAMDGRWVPMKRTALALHQLISTRFRGDRLELIGFGRHAETLQIEQLTGLDAMWQKGTNLHHGLLLAQRHFRRHPGMQPVLLVVTDGEPTAHLERGGDVFFDYPPHPLTLARTVAELDSVVRLGTQTTFFRLGEDPGLARFLDSLARRAGGRVVAPELDDLGAAVVGSYLGDRSGRSPYGGGGGGGYDGGFGDLGGWGGRGSWAG
ncbi:VWA domain-containing protein [Nocardioides sp. ChNu-153]|uniref:vWA domain-containing protein n=1 Tax=unclassified Nocardioides TaxID=2615069 RepID=UPI00240621CD|nr:MULTISPECIES: VWA domain-containing protein [unclassified Nocardioides]MDF9717473.1 VWA domain-containing protein [Nocardioides sp. ChNu-99]MDN7120463.1 VWA domain-containing protein [Nocardioides sp. ChNu-153]